MILVTLLALACGWAVDRARLIRERDEARQAEAEATKGRDHAKRLLMMQTTDPDPRPALRVPSPE